MNSRLKGQVVTSELGMIKVGMLLMLLVASIILFMVFTGTLDNAVEWIWNGIKSGFSNMFGG